MNPNTTQRRKRMKIDSLPLQPWDVEGCYWSPPPMVLPSRNDDDDEDDDNELVHNHR